MFILHDLHRTSGTGHPEWFIPFFCIYVLIQYQERSGEEEIRRRIAEAVAAAVAAPNELTEEVSETATPISDLSILNGPKLLSALLGRKHVLEGSWNLKVFKINAQQCSSDPIVDLREAAPIKTSAFYTLLCG